MKQDELLGTLGEGDVVRISRVVRLSGPATNSPPSNLTRLYGSDTQSGAPTGHSITGNAKVELIAKAPKPKPKAGTVLTGAEMSDIWWKRGTIFRCVESSSGSRTACSASVLLADGRLQVIDDPKIRYEFSDLVSGAKFRLEYVPE